MAQNSIAVQPQNEFSDEVALMYAPFREYVSGVVPLMLEHVWSLSTRSQSNFAEVLLQNSWLGRLITLDKRVLDPILQEEISDDWPKIRHHVLRQLEACKSIAQLSKAVDGCMNVLLPVLERGFRDDYCFPKKKFHSWWFTIHDDNTHLALHLINAYQPESPFEHMEHFASTMLQSVEHGLAAYPEVRSVSCGSWLNQFPKFQQLWPESFKRGQRTLNEAGGFGPGAWGQYMTAKGGFNEINAGILRKTMRHPFALTEARCPVEEVRLHFKNLLARGIALKSI